MMAVCSILAIICIVYGIFVRAQAQELHFLWCGSWVVSACLLWEPSLRKGVFAETSMYGASCLEVCWRQA